jgi:hypothetical protein
MKSHGELLQLVETRARDRGEQRCFAVPIQGGKGVVGGPVGCGLGVATRASSPWQAAPPPRSPAAGGGRRQGGRLPKNAFFGRGLVASVITREERGWKFSML